MTAPRPSRRPTHPGAILKKHYLDPRGLSVTRFADTAGVTRKHASNIVNGRADITPEMAVRIAGVLGTTAAYWLNLQSAFRLYDTDRPMTT